jgi:DNA-binding response OmpR family regulator
MLMENAKILWVDDEIELLKPHVKFLELKGFQVSTASNGFDAMEQVRTESFDIVFLDENMPGMSGLEVLSEIKVLHPHLPVVMITKSEEEHIMEDAIGSKISDYLIKPVNPSQILLACKKILQNRQLVNQKVNTGYQQDFRKIGMQFYEKNDYKDWIDIYKKLSHWEKQMEDNEDQSMLEVLHNQVVEANLNFSRTVMDNYLDWVNSDDLDERPILSPDVLPQSAFKDIGDKYESVFFILVDCMRHDQWKELEPLISEYYYIESERHYYSILPTATQYCRNSIFAGLHPGEIQQKYPRYWKNDNEEGGKNLHEEDLLREHITRRRLNAKFSYHKILTNDEGFSLNENYKNLLKNDFNAIVYNFIDMLSHSRTEVNIIRELAPTPAAYRAVSRSWFEHSPLLELLKKLAQHKVKVVITSDHGTVYVNRPVKIIGDRETTTNLRYKQGRNLSYDNEKFLFTIKHPEEAKLPKMNMSSTYVFTSEDYFFAYPNNYNYYVKFFRDTFQHGGISMHEMIVPLIDLVPKK